MRLFVCFAVFFAAALCDLVPELVSKDRPNEMICTPTINVQSAESGLKDDVKLLEIKVDAVLKLLQQYNFSRIFEDAKSKKANENTGCPSDFQPFRKSCYFFGSMPIDWQNAKRACSAMGSRLVAIEDYREDQFVVATIKKTPGSRQLYGYYTGGNNQLNYVQWIWDWTQRPMTYHRWHTGQPSNAVSQRCLILMRGYGSFYGWANMRCSDRAGFVCERPRSKV